MPRAARNCPAPKCSEQAPYPLLACRTHWNALSAGVRIEVWRTVKLNPLSPDRRAALERALAEWKQQRESAEQATGSS